MALILEALSARLEEQRGGDDCQVRAARDCRRASEFLIRKLDRNPVPLRGFNR